MREIHSIKRLLLVGSLKAEVFLKRLGKRAWERFLSLDNFRKAFKRASKGRGFNSDIRKIRGVIRPGETWEEYFKRRDKRIDRFLMHIIYRLKTFQYTTGSYLPHHVWDPKPRIIYVLRMYPHRIVQHAVIQVIKGHLDKQFIHNNFACRDGKGQHRASAQLSEYVKKYKYCYQGDAKKFYPSIHHRTLYLIMERKIKDKYILWLLNDIINSMPGEVNVPIGNYTSQWFGNMYMNQFDMFVKHNLKCVPYMRYMDDFFLFSNDKKQLQQWAWETEGFLAMRLKLQLSKGRIIKCSNGISAIGFRHFTTHKLLTKRSAKIITKRLHKLPCEWNSGRINLYTFTSQVTSAKGWVKEANCYNFKCKLRIFELTAFTTKIRKGRKMRGFPKYADITTKQDVENLMPLFPKETKEFLKSLALDTYVWQTDDTLINPEDGIVDETHQLQTVYADDNKTIIGYKQQTLVEDENSRMHRLGYTIGKITQLVNALE